MSQFDSFLVAADGIVDQVFADTERFDFQPMVDVPNAMPEDDPDRTAVADIVAIFDDQGFVIRRGEFPDRSTTEPQIIVQVQYVPQGVQIGDRWTRKKDRSIWAVTAVNPDGLNRLVLSLIEVIS
jgi:hypothetical protein